MEKIIESKFSEVNAYAGILMYFGESFPLYWMRRFLKLGDPSETITKEDYLLQFDEIKRLIEQDKKNVKDGLYGPYKNNIGGLKSHFKSYRNLLSDAIVSASRAKLNLNTVFSKEAKKELKDLPEYYQRNFHFQTDGYLSKESAELYEHQTELLFRGTLHLMRRVLLGEMIKKIKAQPEKTFKLLELACGTGVATKFILENCENVEVTAIDLSQPYLDYAQEKCGEFDNVKFLKCNASELGGLNEKFDAVFSCFLFHELPKEERKSVFESAKSALKDDSLGQFHVDSIQYGDKPQLDFALTNFPAHFHEPFYMNYIKTPYSELLPEKHLHSEKRAFFSKLVHIYKA